MCPRFFQFWPSSGQKWRFLVKKWRFGRGGSKVSKTNFFFLSISLFLKVRESNVPSVCSFLAIQWPKMAFLGTDPPFWGVKKLSEIKISYHTISSYIKWTYESIIIFFVFWPWWPKMAFFSLEPKLRRSPLTPLPLLTTKNGGQYLKTPFLTTRGQKRKNEGTLLSQTFENKEMEEKKNGF